jgi:tetratricopeptide (TPR) repeat protein
MANLKDFYTDFFRVDLDARGGYARVADVIARQEDGRFVHRAFKLMRHDLSELSNRKNVGLERFENELKILAEITKDKTAPAAITRIYDSGFAEAKLSRSLHGLQYKEEKLIPVPDLEIISTGTDIQKFLNTKSSLMVMEPDRWLPYLVVDLAPYNDSLARQIKVASSGNKVNLYALPINTVANMALELLDVMDYLHKKLRVAYIDWKPEHIYWNEAQRQLKLIDWNVTTQLKGGLREKSIIREDVRMFSGAALYCSLALTDPEELANPIGPTPTAPRDVAPKILARYWTDKPNFYQREKILDEEIKQLVQKALDPTQGFNSPLELKNALSQFATQNIVRTKDLAIGLPKDAVEHFRRARSYIAAEDYEYAIYWLELAVETAHKAGVDYSDAELLLKNVQDILEINEFKKEVGPVSEKGQWKELLDLYAAAIVQYPNNQLLKSEFGSLRDLVQAELKLRNKAFFKIFTNLFRLRTILDSTKDIMGSDNPLYVFIKQQYNQIKVAQLGSVFGLVVIALFVGVLTAKPKFFEPSPVASATITLANTPSAMPPQTVASTRTPIVVATLPITLTNTIEPTSTLIILGYGKLETYYFKPYDEPNKNILADVAVQRNQILTILAEEVNSGALWYKCVWETDGVVHQGWVLADRITIIKATPTPTRLPYTLDMTFGELETTSYKPYSDDLDLPPQDILLKKNQPLKILGAKEYNRALWYECTWEVDGVSGRGWILAEKIKIVQAPTSIPTLIMTLTQALIATP